MEYNADAELKKILSEFPLSEEDVTKDLVEGIIGDIAVLVEVGNKTPFYGLMEEFLKKNLKQMLEIVLSDDKDNTASNLLYIEMKEESVKIEGIDYDCARVIEKLRDLRTILGKNKKIAKVPGLRKTLLEHAFSVAEQLHKEDLDLDARIMRNYKPPL